MPLMTDALNIGGVELAIVVLFVVAAGGISILNKLLLEKKLLIGSVRCVLQLMVMGYVLKIIFGVDSL
jgi:putative ABC transport system permease protein